MNKEGADVAFAWTAPPLTQPVATDNQQEPSMQNGVGSSRMHSALAWAEEPPPPMTAAVPTYASPSHKGVGGSSLHNSCLQADIGNRPVTSFQDGGGNGGTWSASPLMVPSCLSDCSHLYLFLMQGSRHHIPSACRQILASSQHFPPQ